MRKELADLVHPVITTGLRLKEHLDRGDELLLETEQSALIGLLMTSQGAEVADFVGDARPDRAEGHFPLEGGTQRSATFLGTRYALVCWLDELFVLESSWESQWNERKLEVALYGSNDRAWKFWHQAQIASTRPGGDAIEVFFWCALLGFRGEWREHPERLRSWIAATRAQVTRGQAQEWTAPPEIEPVTMVPPLRGQQKLQQMVLVVGIALLVLIPVVAFMLVSRLG